MLQQRHHLTNLTENIQDYFSWNTECSTRLKNWGYPAIYTARMGFKITRSILCNRTGYSYTHPHARSISIYFNFPASLLESIWKLIRLFYLLLEETITPNLAIVYSLCSNSIVMNSIVMNTVLAEEKYLSFIEHILLSEKGKKEPSTNQRALSPQKAFRSCIGLFYVYNRILSL